MCDQQSLRPACAYAQSDQILCFSLEHSMIVKLLPEHHLEYLCLTGGCRGSSESTLVKMSNCWKSHSAAQYYVFCSYGKWVWPGNATVPHRRPTHGTVRKRTEHLHPLDIKKTIQVKQIITLDPKSIFEPWRVISNNPVYATTKAQISLRIRTVWSEPLLVAWIFYEC